MSFFLLREIVVKLEEQSHKEPLHKTENIKKSKKLSVEFFKLVIITGLQIRVRNGKLFP